ANRSRLSYTLAADRALGRGGIVFVCVGTPSLPTGDADLSAIWAILDELPRTDQRTTFVMKSTVPVGTGEKVRGRLEALGRRHVGYVANPEFLAEGTAVANFKPPDRI